MHSNGQTEAELTEAQARIYRFLGRFFVAAPDEDFIQSLLDDTVLDAVSDCISEDASREFQSLKKGWGTSYDLDALKQDYWGLFEVPGTRYLAPYESVYRKDGRGRRVQPAGRLYGSSTSEVLRNYWRAGTQVSHEFLDLPDHIGAEIEFMAYLHEREAAVWLNGDKDKAQRSAQYREWQEEFLREHLGIWAHAVSERMLEKARTPFYRAVAYMLQSLFPTNRDNSQQSAFVE